MVTAHRRCPQLTVLPVDMQLYRRGSVKVMETLREFSDQVEVVGMDEAYVDLSDSPVPQSRAREIKRRITEETRLVCSIGLAPNKLMAKIASDLDKPDGFFVLDEEGWLPAIGEKPAKLLPGVGPKTDERLRSIGIETVGQLARAYPATLGRVFGPNHGRDLIGRANGEGSADLTTERKRKSESRETTFREDVTDRATLVEAVDRFARSVCESLEQHGSSGRTVTLKIRLQPFRTFTRSRTLPSPTRDAELVAATARELLERFDPTDPVRLIGVGVAGLGPENANDPATPASAQETEAAGSLTLELGSS
jgi:DNA polymerase-4